MKRTLRIIAYGMLTLVSAGVLALILIKTTVNSSVLVLPEEKASQEVVSDAPIVTVQEWPITSASVYNSQQTSNTANTTSTTETLVPVRIEIPALKVNAKIVSVGMTAAGAMATPGRYADVGWYKFGTLPGERGSAVMAGHVDNGLALPGVFKHLVDVINGDEIYVTNSNGERIRFKVMSTVVYNYKEVPVTQIFTRDDGNYLTLITCIGSLIHSEHTYDERLVVTAIKE